MKDCCEKWKIRVTDMKGGCMKWLMALCLCLMCSVACAEWESHWSKPASFDSDWDNLGIIDPITGTPYTDDMLNNYLRHSHYYEYDEYKTPWGFGADIILYKFKEVPHANDYGLRNIKFQPKYDFGNKNFEWWGYVTFDAEDCVRKLFNIK